MIFLYYFLSLSDTEVLEVVLVRGMSYFSLSDSYHAEWRREPEG